MHPVNEGRYHPILCGLRRNAGVHVKTEFCGVDWRWFQHGLISRIRRFDSYPPQPKYGRVGEWFMPIVLKTIEPQGSVSSNLTSSAKIRWTA